MPAAGSKVGLLKCHDSIGLSCLQVHNAGVMLDQYSQSKQGHEIHFATNHLGPALLTQQLLPNLATPGGHTCLQACTPPGRTVNHTTGGLVVQATHPLCYCAANCPAQQLDEQLEHMLQETSTTAPLYRTCI